jgi:2-methylcitrate dehydratase
MQQEKSHTRAEQLAAFVADSTFDDLSPEITDQLKIRIVDALACAFGALDEEIFRPIRSQLEDFGGNSLCSLIGGGRNAPDRAAFFNGALVRYLDFNDSYLAKGETCHPSDNLAPVLAAAEYANASGRDLLTALAVAYQVQCRLSDIAPVRDKGFDHTTQGAYAVAAGVSRALGLDAQKTANAIAICGTAFNALRVTRTGAVSHWKGLAYPNLSFACTHAVFLAMRGITGPLEVFEGNKGFMQAISGPFEIDWSQEELDRPAKTIVKKYNAEIHSQSVIEALLELKREHDLRPSDVNEIEVETFDVAYKIIGGGEEGNKTVVRTKEQADHSLPYILAVALLDGRVMPEQYRPERLIRQDVQNLLRRVKVHPAADLSRRFPLEMPCRVHVRLHSNLVLSREKSDYEGFFTKPIGWARIGAKFERLANSHATASQRSEIMSAVLAVEQFDTRALMALLRVPDSRIAA